MQNAIKKSFEKVKQDINDLSSYLLELKKEIELIKKEISQLKRTLSSVGKFQHISNTNPTHKKQDSKFLRIKPYFSVSTGNKGVPTLLRHSYVTPTSHLTELLPMENQREKQQEVQREKGEKNQNINQEKELKNIGSTLSQYKSEIIKRFKNLTRKEFEIFTLIYTLQETNEVTYKLLAEKTGLAPSSVRDLVNRLVLKGIPIEKMKNINREIVVRIPDELKKISSLDALEKLVNYYGFK